LRGHIVSWTEDLDIGAPGKVESTDTDCTGGSFRSLQAWRCSKTFVLAEKRGVGSLLSILVKKPAGRVGGLQRKNKKPAKTGDRVSTVSMPVVVLIPKESSHVERTTTYGLGTHMVKV